MAYSDYGGYAFKNGVRVEDRSDAVLSPEGIQSTPGQWPGWTLPESRMGDSYHVLLGDGPIFVSLYKQSYIQVHRLAETIALPQLERDYGREEQDADVDVDGCHLQVRWRVEDNHYVYVRLTQPDGAVWTGWSGYGVGAGLEDADYGYSTEDRTERLLEFWPLP